MSTHESRLKLGVGSSPKPIDFEYMTVTPEDARELLGRNAHNRAISERIVARYAGDILSGSWTLTHQPIAVGPDGELVDGQHRLAAIVRAAVPVRIVLAIYRDAAHAEDARQKVDLGRTRRGGDVFEIAGTAKRGMGKRVYSVVVSLAQIDAPEPTGGWTPAEVSRRYAEEKRAVDFAASLPCRGFPAPVAGAFAFAHPVAPEQIESFAAIVREKANLAPNTAAHLYVQATASGGLTASKMGDDRVAVSQRVLRLLHMHLTGETMSKVQTSPKGLEYFRKHRANLKVGKAAGA